MVDFMLDNLCRKAAELCLLLCKVHIAIFDLYRLEPFRFALPNQRQTAFRRLVPFGRMLYNLWIQHGDIRIAKIYGNNAFGNTNHISGQADTALAVRREPYIIISTTKKRAVLSPSLSAARRRTRR